MSSLTFTMVTPAPASTKVCAAIAAEQPGADDYVATDVHCTITLTKMAPIIILVTPMMMVAPKAAEYLPP
ncbi:MAG: hypothetical protein J2P18_14350 [Nocardia sp.]|nr:hypothetical protein [Nocardia sp.]